MIGNQSAKSAALHIMQMTLTMLHKKVKNESIFMNARNQ